MVAFIIILFLVVLFLAFQIKVVPQTQAYVIERLGVYNGVWDTGIHIKVPFIDRIVKKISLKEQVVDFKPQSVITKDNVTIKVDSIVFYQVTDPKLFAYGIERPILAIENLTATTLRNIFGDLELDSTLTSRDVINTKITTILDKATDSWGIKVNRVELKNIEPPKDIREAMEKQMRAERERREQILQAEGQKKSDVLIAEGRKEAQILSAQADKEAAILRADAVKEQKIREAEGEAEAIRLIKEAEAQAIAIISESKPTDQYLAIRRYEALEEISRGPASKLVIPAEMQSLAATISTIKDM